MLRLDLVVDGERQTIRVDDDGHPFRTSAGRAEVPHYIWAYYLESVVVAADAAAAEDHRGPAYTWDGTAWIEP